MDALRQDLRYALRHLRHSPGFAAAAIVILALGIGANTAMFSILNGLLLRDLPIKDPGGLVGIQSFSPGSIRRQILVTVVEHLEKDGPFQQVCAINGGGVFPAEVNGGPTQTVVATITGSCFDVFGVQPLLGRPLTQADAPVYGKGALVTVISHRFWMRMFGGDTSVIGKTIRMEGVELAVVGVMPAGFVGLQADSGTDLYLSNYSITPVRAERPASTPQLIGRLKPGITLESARAELSARWPALMDTVMPATLTPLERTTFQGSEVRVESVGRGLNFYRERYGRSVRLIAGLTLVLMLLACINLGGLLLTRLNARAGELSVRLALGSTGSRLAQQMLLESLIVSLTGAFAGVPVALAIIQLIASFIPTPMVDHSLDFSLDSRILAATAAIGVLAGLLMSALPIWLAWRRHGRLLASDRTVVSATSRWARSMLVAQVALSMVMLTGAALLIRSLYLLQRVDTGVRAERVLVVDLMPLPNAYRTINNATYFRTLTDEIGALPGVRALGFTRVFPGATTSLVGQLVGFVNDPEPAVRAQLESVSPGLFETLGVPLLRGRLPEWTDTAQSQQVALVSDSLARKLSPDGDVLGRHVKFGTGRADQDVEIVGVVGNMSFGNLRETAFPVFYRPILQAGLFANYPNLIVKGDGDVLALVPGILDIVKQHNKEYAHRINTLEAVFEQSPTNERMSASLAGVIAALALALAFVGIYSLLAYSVTRRTREIGVRVALGADRRGVIRMVMRDGVIVTAIGVALGIPATFFANRILGSLLFGVSGSDPLALAASIMMFLALGLAAGIAPATRAASVDPAIALRTE